MIAGVVYTLISIITGTSASQAIGIGAIYLVGTTIVVFIAATIISKVISNRRT